MASSIRSGKDIGVALLGCGSWGRNHLRVWRELGLLRAACDVNPARLDEVRAENPGLDLYTSAADVLDRPDVDAVVIATTAATHEDLALLALARGKDVLIEKPLALTLDGGARIVEAARRAERILLVGHVLEYHPAVRMLEELIGTGTLGRVQYTYSNRVNLGRFRAEENALWSFAPHDVAVMLRLLGDEVEEVSCHGGAYLQQNVADITLTALSFRNGVRGHIFVSWLHPFKEHRFVVVGDRQMAVFDDALPWSEKLSLYPHRVDWMEGRRPVVLKAEAVPVPLAPADPLSLECAHFVECVRTRAEPRTAGASGVRVLRILDAAQQSLERGGIPERLGKPVERAYYAHPTATIDPGARIGDGTKIWHHAHVMGSASIGADCMLGQNVFVAAGVSIGRGARIQNNVSVYEGVELEEDVFCGPSMVFTNVSNPRAAERRRDFRRTLIRRGATIGANATIVCGVTLGRYAFVAAGAVVTHDVPDHGLVMGVPARLVGWACECGERLLLDGGTSACSNCGRRYRLRSEASIEREIGPP